MTEPLEARIAPATLTFVDRLANDPDASDLVATDASGNIYVAGVFHGRFAQDGALPEEGLVTSDPDGDVYIAKYNTAGDLLWMRSWGGVGVEDPKGIAVDASGNAYVTGSFDSPSAGFGLTNNLSTAAGVSQLFVFKVQGTSGAPDLSWGAGGSQLQFGGTAATAVGTAITFGSGGELFVGGNYSGTSLGFNNGIVGLPVDDGTEAMVIRITSSGNPNPDWGTGGVVQLGELTGGTGSNVDIFRLIPTSTGLYVGAHEKITTPSPLDVYGTVKLTGGSGARDTSFNGGSPLIFGVGQTVQPTDFALDSQERIYAATSHSSIVTVSRYTTAGVLDDAYGPQENGGGGLAFFFAPAKSVTLAMDNQDRLYVGGVGTSNNYVARLTTAGFLDPQFLGDGLGTFGKPQQNTTGPVHFGMALDSNGYLILRDSYVGSVDLDPTSGVKKLSPRSVGGGNQEGFLMRLNVEAVDPGGSVHIDAGVGPNGRPSEVVVKLTGPGELRVIAPPANQPGNISRIELTGTTMASQLTIVGVNLSGTRTVNEIITLGGQQDLGGINLSSNLVLGNGATDLIPDLLVTGRVGKMTLGDINAGALIKFGQDLPYNLPGTKDSDTYNNRPDLTIGTVLGAGVIIDVLGDGTPGGIGGGGLGNVVIGQWSFQGYIKTTQSLGNFTVKNGDFWGILEIDKFHNGEETTAGVGNMDVQNGDWGSSGSEIEGDVTSFNAEEFLAGASITAGNVGKVTTDGGAGSGGFNGTLTLTDEDATKAATFNIATDFTGTVISFAPLKKIVIKADFRGSLTAPSIAAVTAFSFLGDDANPDLLKITTTDGLLGKITAKSGIVKNFTFASMNAGFSGLNVVLKNADADTVGIENVKINALTIGPISVQLTGAKNLAGIDLTGIKNSTFIANSPTGATIGKVTVKVSGGSGTSTGLSTGLEGVSFSGDTIGNVSVTVNKAAGGTARAVVGANFHAKLNLGSFTFGGNATEKQVDDLTLWSGGKIGAVAVSAKTASFGILQNSQIYAGQSLDFAGATTDVQIKAKLAAASLAGVKVGGDLRAATIVAGANLGAITVGGALQDSLLVAGILLGGDETTGGGDDTYQRAAKIASVTVKGALSATSISAGINRGNGVFGDGDDVLGLAAGASILSSEIGKVSIGAGVFGEGAPAMAHGFAIQAAKIAKITVKGQPALSNIVDDVLLDLAGDGEDATDVLIRVLA